MYKVLIVDDEPTVVRGIKNSVNWSMYNIEVCATASNGAEAYELIKEKEPDIVITDVKMPCMNGIELIQKTVQTHPKVQFIIISAYAEFEYAKQAMRNGVMYYLLKPASIYEIEDILEEITGGKNTEKGERGDSPENEELAVRYKEQMDIVFDYIEKNIDNPNINLGFISRELIYMSSDHFGRIFKKITGKFYTQYVMEKRMERAAALLRDTDMMIYEVAESVGFGGNATYFGQVFKRYFSVTPQQYRKQSKQL
ncbi:MAG: response regulator [Clostridia bacterium]|nr:response regulator [Clostridia bacterium]